MSRAWWIPLSLVCLSIATAQTPVDRNRAFDNFLKDTYDRMLDSDPDAATLSGRHAHDDQWTDFSKQGRAQRREFLEQRLSTLEREYPVASLTPENQVTARLMAYDFRSRLDAYELETHLLAVGQLYGVHNRVFLTLDRMPAQTVHDYENILARIRAVPKRVDQFLGVLDEAIAAKMTQPAIVIDVVGKQMAAQMNQSAEQSELLKAFRRFPASVPASEQARLKQEAVKAYDEQFLPSWRKMYQYFTTTYAANARPADSVSSMAHGKEAYAILIRRLTTTNMTAAEIHKLGLSEVNRIEGQMERVLRDAGFSGTIAEFQKKLDSMPEQHFRSREEMLAYCRDIAKRIEPELPNQFRNIPRLLYGIRAIPPDREAATASNAQRPSPDYSAPGWFNLNAYEPEKQNRYTKEALVLHEAVPGHIYQGSVALAQNLPDIRKAYGNSAFAEGWALYAESLGPQLGMYRDPYSRFGQLASERFRAVRLVVDTGIHDLGWTRAQALDYFHAHAPEQSVAEIDRYISWPAQALSYKIGELRIKALRAKAEQALGAAFDVRSFNDAVIREATLPLDLLNEQIDAYIASARK